jgi:hypothetical protein
MTITEEFRSFKPGTRARALFYLKTGVLDGDAHPTVQARLDRWVDRIERHGPAARERVLRKLEEGGQ